MIACAFGDVWYGSWSVKVMAKVHLLVATGGWVLTDRHDPAPRAANDLLRATLLTLLGWENAGAGAEVNRSHMMPCWHVGAWFG